MSRHAVILYGMKVLPARQLFAMAAWVLLVSCAQNPPAPVTDLTTDIPAAGATSAAAPQSDQTVPGHYTVETGDTLFSIAFRNQLDWQEVAQWNDIGPPYVIYPGQDLRLAQPPGNTHQAASGVTTQGVAAQAPSVVRTVTSASQPDAAQKPSVSEPDKTSAQPPPAAAASVTAAVPSVAEESSPAAKGIKQRQAAGVSWTWPVEGPLLDRYDAVDPTRQGIDIGGRRGTPVKAAANGVVVYSGNGLVGYGELVIVKHSDVFLSAYGHNSKRLVKEGERVKAGQTIAEMGSSGTSRTELHFEIRKQGRPVDPMAFLPRP